MLGRSCPSPLSRGRGHSSWHSEARRYRTGAYLPWLNEVCGQWSLPGGAHSWAWQGVPASSCSNPHLPGFLPHPTPFSPACRKEEALPVSQAISQVTITTKHLKCQHLGWFAFRHNWRQSGNTTREPCKRKQGEARQERREIKREEGGRKTRINKVLGAVDLPTSHYPQGTSFHPAWRAGRS